MQRLLNMKEAAVYMGISFPSWKSYVAKRVMPNGTPIPIVPVGLRRINFDIRDLDKLIERLKVVPMEKFRSVI